MRTRALTVMCYLAGCWCLAGCGDSGEFKQVGPGSTNGDAHDHHDHAEHGPHGGHVVELGEHEYHAEVVHDPKKNSVTVYLFGHDLDEPLPIEEQEITIGLEMHGGEDEFTLTASPLESEAEGKSSRFEIVGDEEIAEHIEDEEDLIGTVTVKIGEKSYSGKISHDHHDHKDGDHDHKDGHHDHKDGDHDHKDADHDHKDGGHDHKDGDHDHKDGDHDEKDGDADHKDGDAKK